MHWKNTKDLKSSYIYLISKYPKFKLFLLLPNLAFAYVWYMGCLNVKCNSDYMLLWRKLPILIAVVLFVYVLVYICKPLNDYLGLKQEFDFFDDKVAVKNYFKNYFQHTGEYSFLKSEIQSITCKEYIGMVVHVTLFDQIWIPFLTEEDHQFLMNQFNPHGTVKVIKNAM